MAELKKKVTAALALVWAYLLPLVRRTRRRRVAERTVGRHPVILPFGTGMTRDFSTTGVFFETDMEYALGSSIDLAIEFDTPEGKLNLKAMGEIVRVQRIGTKIGIAVRMTEQKLQAAGGDASPTSTA